jgi:hypothetical protein
MRLRGTLVALGSLLILLGLGSPASAIPIGANLNRPANYARSCAWLPSTDAFGSRLYIFHGITSCTYMSAGDIRGRESAGVPAPGVLVQARVRTGPFATGPMRFTILTAIRRRRGGASCCFHAAQSQVFTPRSNGITTVNVRLPMQFLIFRDPNTGERVDYLGLSVLAGGFPVPAFDGGVPGNINRPSSLGFYPFIGPGQGRVDYSGVGDFIPLINGEFVPLCGGPQFILRQRALAAADRAGGEDPAGLGATASGRGRCVPLVGVAGGTASRQGAAAALALLCNLTSACNGLLRLQASRVGGRASASARPVTYARGRFRLRSGGRKRVKVKLTSAGKKLLRKHAKARVWANVTMGKKRRSSVRVTLRR